MRHRFIYAVAAAALVFLAITTTASAIPPTITDVTFSSVTPTSATLQAEINPESKATKYRFEYGLADCASNPCISIPAPDGELPSGTTAKPVSAKLEGLTPATTYHFRVITESKGLGGGKTVSPEETFATYHFPQIFGSCPNDAFRKGKPSETLPDCRAYEQASPIQKNGLDADGRVSLVKASSDGERASFISAGGMPGGEGSQDLPFHLARRTAGGWGTIGLLPPATIGAEAFIQGWTPDFSQIFVSARRFDGSGGGSFLSRSGADGSSQTIIDYGDGLKTQSPDFVGSSADGSIVLFESKDELTSIPEAIQGAPNLYYWNRDTGTIGLAGVLNNEGPNGISPPEGAIGGSYDWIGSDPASPNTGGGGAAIGHHTEDERVISVDGKNVFFTEAGSGQLYLRRNPTEPQSALNGEGECTEPAKACTIHVSASQKANGPGGGPDPAGTRPAAFMGATPDGSAAFFTSSEKLTNDANTGPEQLSPAIARANLSDGSAKNLSFLPADALGLTVEGEHIYWADPENGSIGRAKLNGSGDATEVKPKFITGAGNPKYVAVDSEHVYWSNPGPEGDGGGPLEKGTGAIARAELPDGNNVDLDFIVGASHPQGVAVNSEHIYWANAGDAAGNGTGEDETRTIGRAKLDGSEVKQDFIPVGGGASELRPQGLVINASHIFVGINATQRTTFVNRFDINGDPESGKFLFLGERDEQNASGVRGIVLDAGHVYWTWQDADQIGRANLELGEKDLEFIKEADRPFGLALDAEHLYWTANQGAPPNPGNDLYRFDVDTGELTDLAPDPTDVNGADVLGVLGTSEDGSHAYFVANGDLDGAGPAQAGNCEGTAGTFVDFKGECSLYLAREGEPVVFVARLDANQPDGANEIGSDAANWIPHGVIEQLDKTSRVSAEGDTLLFRSHAKLTSYDNEDIPQLYLYRVGGGVICVSCNPTESAPLRSPKLASTRLSNISPDSFPNTPLSRNLSADGNRVFFETTEPLVAEDANGAADCPDVGSVQGFYPACIDAYMWEEQGTGSCEQDMQGGGCLYLLSTGKSTDASFLADASTSGDEAFLFTRSQLVGQDEDQLYDLYGASVGGGLTSQYSVAPDPCEGEGCRAAANAPPASQSAGSASFAGPPNPKARKPKPRCPKSKRRVRSKGKTRCVAKKQPRQNTKTKRRTNR